MRSGFSAADLRALARGSQNAKQCAWLFVLAAVAEGKSRAEAVRIRGMNRQTLRDWVHRFNGEGPDLVHHIRASMGSPHRGGEEMAQRSQY